MTKEELSQCVDSCGDALYGFCLHLTGSRSDTDDLFQDSFLKALEKIDKIRFEDNPESYLMGIASRLWKNQLRKKSRRKQIIGLDSLEERQELGEGFQLKESNGRTPEEMTIDHECNEKLMSYVRELKPTYRIIISLYYEAGKSVREISNILRIPQGTVKYRLSQARKVLRKKMEEAGYDR